jgi:hypothetical protein
MQRKNIISIAIYGVVILIIATILLTDQGMQTLLALFR